MAHRTYVGPMTAYLGKTADTEPGATDASLLVQFDDVTTGLGYGWHTFPTSHFTSTPFEEGRAYATEGKACLYDPMRATDNPVIVEWLRGWHEGSAA